MLTHNGMNQFLLNIVKCMPRNSTESSCLMRISLVRISSLRFFKTFQKCLPYVFLGLFILLVRLLTICLMWFMANATFSSSQKSHKARTLSTRQMNALAHIFTFLCHIGTLKKRDHPVSVVHTQIQWFSFSGSPIAM